MWHCLYWEWSKHNRKSNHFQSANFATNYAKWVVTDNYEDNYVHSTNWIRLATGLVPRLNEANLPVTGFCGEPLNNTVWSPQHDQQFLTYRNQSKTRGGKAFNILISDGKTLNWYHKLTSYSLKKKHNIKVLARYCTATWLMNLEAFF